MGGTSLPILVRGRFADSQSVNSSAALPREVKMFAIATAALIVLSTTAEAATKYNYGGRGSYKPSYEHIVYGSDNGHEAYKMSDYSHEPSYASYESHYADQEYSYDRRHDYREHDEEDYGGDAYSEEPTYTHEPRSAYRHKRQASVQDEGGAREPQEMGGELFRSDRERLSMGSCKGGCTNEGPGGRHHRPCRTRASNARNRHFCYIGRLICADARQSALDPNINFSTEACCGNRPCR